MDAWDTSENDPHDQAVSAVTDLRLDVLDLTDEQICWNGTGELAVRAPGGDQTAIGTLHTGECLDATAGTGAYRLKLGTDQVIGVPWDIRVCSRSVSAADCLTVDANEHLGRLWSNAWQFLENGLFAAKRSNNGSLFTIVSGGAPGSDAVMEIQLRGLSGAHYQLYANAIGPEMVDGTPIGRSFLEWKDLNADEVQQADEPQITRVTPTRPLYLNPPASASYDWVPPQIMNLRLLGQCSSRVVEADVYGELFFESNVVGRYTLICDVNQDGVYDAASQTDFSSTGAAVVGGNTIAWDGRNNAGRLSAPGSYQCTVRLSVGEFHFSVQDVETSYPGMRMFRLNGDRTTRVGRPMFWDDSLLVPPDDPEPMNDVAGQFSPSTPPALGLEPGAYTDAPSAFYYAGGAGGAAMGNARAWGNFDGDGKGTDNFLDQVAAADSTVSAPFTVNVLGPNGDADSDGLTNARECEIGSDAENADTDMDNVPDGIEATAFSNPNTDSSGRTDVLDQDSDNDGVQDGSDVDRMDPHKCRDFDNDGCDDCTLTGADLSGGDPANDGYDPDGDGQCDPAGVSGIGGEDDDIDDDGVVDVDDIDPNDPNRCRDVDMDGCDDCTHTGDDRSGGDPSNDGDDSDGDGICDPTSAGIDTDTDTDTDGVPDELDRDDDNDGISDLLEGDGDADGDGEPNTLDRDSDGDGLSDLVEAGGAELDKNGDGVIDQIVDESPHDGVDDSLQRPDGMLPLPDSDGDGTPDFLDPDDDNDKLPSLDELDGEGHERDTDGDGIPDHLDADDDDDELATNDELDEDDKPRDTDGDGTPDHLDSDDDDDHLHTNDELDEENNRGPRAAEPDAGVQPMDTDGDGMENHRDTDDDNDRLPTSEELAEDDQPIDTDDDGTPNHLDPDDDNDKIPTTDELDKNGHPIDTDDDGIPNHLDPDDDGDGIPTDEERGDSDKDDKPDYLEPGLQGTLAGGALCSVRDLGGHSSPTAAWLCLGGLLVCVVLRRRRNARAMKRSAAASVSKVLLAAGSLGAAAAAASPAAAQVALDQFKPAPLADDGFGVGRPTVIPHGTFGAALIFDYANDPIVYENVAGDPDTAVPVIDHDLVMHAGLAYGLWDRLALFAMLPIHLLMEGDTPSVPVPPAEGGGLGDLVLGGRVRIIGEDKDAFALAGEFMGRLPTAKWADEDTVYRGDAYGSYEPALIAELRAGRFDARLRAGARFRDKVTVGNLDLGQEFVYGLGFRFRLVKTFTLHAEAYGSTYFDEPFKREYTALEALGGAKLSAGDFHFGAAAGPGLVPGYGSPDLRVVGMLGYAESKKAASEEQDPDHDGLIGAADNCPSQPEDQDGFQDSDGCPDPDNDGDGVPDDSDRCPNEAEDIDGYEDADGCPDPDNDGDGILDVNDACPTVAEDMDGFTDDDGCPDPDNDRDGILDENDRCPTEPEDYDGWEDADGCPEAGEGLIKLSCERIEINDMVHFDTGSDHIQERSFAMLDQIVAMLQQVKRIKRLRVDGHADDRGPDAFNLELAQRRAESVRRYLLDHGVEESRVGAEGFGEAHPIASNETAQGRLQNRRVEFNIIESESEDCPKQPQTEERHSEDPHTSRP